MSTSKNQAAVTIAKAPPDLPSSPAPSPQQQQIHTAAAYLSTTGPCRQIGDMYLTCVATSGLGMCKSYRYAYQQCVQDISGEYGRSMLSGLADQVCSHISVEDNNSSSSSTSSSSSSGEEKRLECAAGFVLGQMMAGGKQTEVSAR